MNVLNKVTWAAMWKNRTRTIVTIIGIILSAAMFTAVTTLGVSVIGYLVDCVVYTSGDYFVRFDYSTDAQLAELHQEEAISRVGDLKALGYATFELPAKGISETCIVAAGDEDFQLPAVIQISSARIIGLINGFFEKFFNAVIANFSFDDHTVGGDISQTDDFKVPVRKDLAQQNTDLGGSDFYCTDSIPFLEH